jgi:DNA-directed RNA polymerase subunit RPC12/RpoP
MGFVRQNNEELEGFITESEVAVDVLACPGCGKALNNRDDITPEGNCTECGSPLVVSEGPRRKKGRKHHRRTALARGRARERAAMAEVLDAAAEEGGEWN